MQSPTAAPPAYGEVPRLTPATRPPEGRGLQRDEVRLLVSTDQGHSHHRFLDLPELLAAGDVLVVNDSGTIAASLPATASSGNFTLNLCTRYGDRLWLAEPRESAAHAGSVPLRDGERVQIGGIGATVVASYPGIPRLRFFGFERDPSSAIAESGLPIRYAYATAEPEIAAYQTVFASRPGSAEMPSAARPFSARVLRSLQLRGVELVRVTLHTGVSSLDREDLEGSELYPEPFEVTPAAAAQLEAARISGRRLVAVGTTVVRALASAWDGDRYRPRNGMTRAFVRPGGRVPPVAGLLTGFHDPGGTHLQLLEAVAGRERVLGGYRAALAAGYLWHEFGDVHLLLGE